MADWYRSAFKQDFGVEIPVEGGDGTTSDPIVLAVTNPADASRAAEITLACLIKGHARAIGAQMLWRVLSSEPTRNSYVYYVEILLLTPTEAIRETRRYYFSAPLAQAFWPAHVVALDPATGAHIPYKLAWLENTKIIDNEGARPGLGWTYGYRTFGVDLTIYVYSFQLPPITPGERSMAVAEQLELAIEDASRRPETKIGAEIDVGPFLSEHVRAVRVDIGSTLGFACVDYWRDRFVKCRMSWLPDERSTCVRDTVQAVRELFISADIQRS